MNWTPKRTLVAGAILILGVNVIALTGVAYNRSGQPDSTLVLTERELRRPAHDWGFADENSGLALKLQWRVRTEDSGNDESHYLYTHHYGDPVWLTSERLAELGFDVSQPPDTERARRRYDKAPAKEVLIVLELGGDTYRAVVERARNQARAAASSSTSGKSAARAEAVAKRLEHEENWASRLFAVDAGTDAERLRAKYADRTRYALVHGRIQPRLTGEGKRARVRGYIEALSIEEVHVPLEFRPVFEGLAAAHDYATPSRRFEAVVSHGRRFEPWLAAARRP